LRTTVGFLKQIGKGAHLDLSQGHASVVPLENASRKRRIFFYLFFILRDAIVEYMPAAIVWIFLVATSTFASVHNFAVAASLYWYYSWFDILMHFWGGILIVLGVYALCSFKHVPLKPTTLLIFSTLLAIMLVWEIFEYYVGLYEPTTYLFDTLKDIAMGFSGGLAGYLLTIRLRM
jgi:hypothetical protein